MVKVLRISDELHGKVKWYAEKDRRTINAMAEMLIEAGMSEPAPLEVPTEGAMFFPPANQVRVNVSDLLKTETPEITEKIGAKARDKGDILSDIRDLEAERDEEVRYSQDVEYSKLIVDKYAPWVQALWAEYNALKDE